jgi:Reverse transcriptase (RNA-dependent DNA polymerase)
MVDKIDFVAATKRAVQNVIKHGDTDIFPFSFETHAFFDRHDDLCNLVLQYNDNFDDYIIKYPPENVSSLYPVTHSGFRWATQIDPIWNVHFLACVLSLASRIESVRIPTTENVVFSYRFNNDDENGDLFDRNIGWVQFMQHSSQMSENRQFVVSCDISEFYSRLGHHRLETALKQIAGDTEYPGKIKSFLSHFSNTNSFGLPVGGPAARLLSELTINQIDWLLISEGIQFTRFADDYHLFSDSRDESYQQLIFLSDTLYMTQGLSLQKSKTRIMSSAEFRATNPLNAGAETPGPEAEGKAVVDAQKAVQLMSFSLHFDPYSPTARDDYQKLQKEIQQFDIVNMLKEELGKSRIHIALSKKRISAIKYLDDNERNNAVLSLMDNHNLLYPIMASVLLAISEIFNDLNESVQDIILNEFSTLVKEDSYVFRVDIYLSFAIRVFSHRNSIKYQSMLHQMFERRISPLVRRDIIVVMANWGNWHWLSYIKHKFRQLSGPERRAFIVASFSMSEEGQHWRQHIRKEFSPFEEFIARWGSDKANKKDRKIPL